MQKKSNLTQNGLKIKDHFAHTSGREAIFLSHSYHPGRARHTDDERDSWVWDGPSAKWCPSPWLYCRKRNIHLPAHSQVS